jgi:hypothetical protein
LVPLAEINQEIFWPDHIKSIHVEHRDHGFNVTDLDAQQFQALVFCDLTIGICLGVSIAFAMMSDLQEIPVIWFDRINQAALTLQDAAVQLFAI